MMRTVYLLAVKVGVLSLLLLQPLIVSAEIWQDVSKTELALKGFRSEPIYYRALRANHDALQQTLAAAPLADISSQGAELLLPMPDGGMQRFSVENSPVMEPELAARYPEIQTYRIKGIDDPSISGRLDMTQKGFHGMLTTPVGTVFIDPDSQGGYRSYYKQDYVRVKRGLGETPPHVCGVEESGDTSLQAAGEVAMRTGAQRRVYRLAVAATGEYTQYHGGTVPDALAEIVTAINRVNEIYGRDVAIQFVLVANNDSIVYTDPDTDPYTNNNGTEMLAENQQVLDRVIGSSNYDIGHVFSTGGGGIANVGVTCRARNKAKGVTGMTTPEGDAFYIDLVAHEMGHQFNADHTFNGTTDACAGINRVAVSAVEPGSGSTIMSYAGICGAENLQLNADATFHARSIEQIVAYSTSDAGSTCGTVDSTVNTEPLNVNAGGDFTIPQGTPFMLIGSADDPNGDTLSYQWDQVDADGRETNENTFGTDLFDNPLFRSFLPKDTPLRVFPRLSSLLANVSDPSEVLPTTSRTLNFRLTVRDGESGVNEDDVLLSVENTAGPFAVTSVLGALVNGQPVTVTWDVANTNLAPINCTQVDIDLLAFSNNMNSYCVDELATNVDNDGIHSVILQNDHGATKGRIRVQCSDNIFFAINDSNLVMNAPIAAATDCISTDGLPLEHGKVFNDADSNGASGGTGGGITLPSRGGGGGALLLFPLLLGLGLIGRIMIRSMSSRS